MRGSFQQIALSVFILFAAPTALTWADDKDTPKSQPTIPSGFRVFSVKTAPIAFKLTPGDHVRVIGFVKDGEDAQQYDVLNDVQVFSTDSAVDKQGKKVNSLALLVTAKDSERLAMAQEHCKLEIKKVDLDSAFYPAIKLTGDLVVLGDLYLLPSQSQVLTVAKPVVSVNVSNSSVIAQPLAPNRIRVGAVKLGVAVVTLKGEDWKRSIRVQVGVNLDKPLPVAEKKDRKDPNFTVSDASDSSPANTSSPRSLNRTVNLTQGLSEEISFPAKIQQLSNTNKSIARVGLSSPQGVQIVGLDVGRARLQVGLDDGQEALIEVVVASSTAELESVLKEIFPKLDLKLVGLKSSIVLLGEIDDPQQASDIIRIAEDYYPSAINRMSVKGGAAPKSSSNYESGRQKPSIFDPPGGNNSNRGFSYGVTSSNRRTSDGDNSNDNRSSYGDVPPRKANSSDPLDRLTNEVRSLRSDVQQLIRLLEQKTKKSDIANEKQAPSADDSGSTTMGKPIPLTRHNRWVMPLENVISIALNNKHLVVTNGKQHAIGRNRNDVTLLEFEREVSELLLNVESAYWRLWEAQQELFANESYSERWSELKQRLPNASDASVEREALDQSYVAALVSFREREQELRHVMGLASADGRLIWPATAPKEQAGSRDASVLEANAFKKSVELDEFASDLRKFEAQMSLVDANLRDSVSSRKTLAKLRSLQLQIARTNAAKAELRERISRRIVQRQNELERSDAQLRDSKELLKKLTDQFSHMLKQPTDEVFAVVKTLRAESVRQHRLQAERMRIELEQLESAGLLLDRHQVRLAEAESADPPRTRGFYARSKRFVVRGPTTEVSERVAAMADEKLLEISKHWFGEEPNPWDGPCIVTVNLKSGLASGGSTSFKFHNRRLAGMSMKLQASSLEKLEGTLAHEVAHLVLAGVAGKPLPRWLDEGLALRQESHEEQEKMRRLMQQFKTQNRLVPTRTLLIAKTYPDDLMPIFAQGHSLVEFLVKREGLEAVTEFLREGAETDEWGTLLLDYFGFRSIQGMESEWLATISPELTHAKRQADR